MPLHRTASHPIPASHRILSPHATSPQADSTISEEEAANIVGFFDRDGDGHLRYAEFMNMLQGTKNSVLTTKVLSQRGHIERPGREIH
jgi:hypothetical protein